MEEQFITDDKEAQLKYLRERLMFWYEKECEYHYQMEEMVITNRCPTREYRQMQDEWRDVQ